MASAFKCCRFLDTTCEENPEKGVRGGVRPHAPLFRDFLAKALARVVFEIIQNLNAPSRSMCYTCPHPEQKEAA